MAELTFSSMTLPSAHLYGQNNLPPLLETVRSGKPPVFALGEDNELFTDLGRISNILPYRNQDLFDRALVPAAVRTAVLENDRLRATFLPDFGGKLWSLYDKEAGRELLYTNDCIRPGNLALRHAWLSGGVEWNCGMIGHTPLTCDTLFTARLEAPDGTPVLRFYAFERVREITYQMDFLLPEGSPVLLCRMRIRNGTYHTIPMYWWSNIAAREAPGWRLVVRSHSAYNGADTIQTVPVRTDGEDTSYPTNVPISRDTFFQIEAGRRKYIAYLSPQGDGFFQTSTTRLKARKLFSWGQGPGGDTWQQWLTDKAGRYIELQAGLGQTQYECIPMPPCAAWEWMEAYGPLRADPARIHGDWDGACTEAEERIEALIGEQWLEDFLRDSRETVARKPATLVYAADGWGALENRRRAADGEPPLEEHLAFGEPGEEQRNWVSLLDQGHCERPDPAAVPSSYLVSEPWFNRLQKAVEGPDSDNWYAWYQLGVMLVYRQDFERAEEAFRRSLALADSCWARFGVASCCVMRREDGDEAAAQIQAAACMRPDDVSLARACGRVLTDLERYEALIAVYPTFSEAVRADSKMRFYQANALGRSGRLEEAEAVLFADGGLRVADLKEGELSITNLWYTIERQKAERAGRPFDEAAAVPPAFLDFRMAAPKQTPHEKTEE